MSGLQGREREKVGQEKRGIYKIYIYIYKRERGKERNRYRKEDSASSLIN